jgi:chromosome segregation ATPase
MARGGVNKAVVKIARNALLARGVHPSIDAVRVELGNTGSKTTIQRYLRELTEAETPEPEMPVDEELARYIGSLVERMEQMAQSALARDRAAFEREQAGARHQREVEQAGLEQLQQAHAALIDARQEDRTREQALTGQLKSCELEHQRLQEALTQQLRLLEERATQISSLEEKHRYTQDALEHYREQHLVQRERETQRHDQLILQLQHEGRVAQEQLLSKTQEVSQLYRDLERMSGEHSRVYQEARKSEQALVSAQEQLKAAQLAHLQDQEQIQSMSHQATTLREKAKQYLRQQRHTQRQLKALQQQLNNANGGSAPFPA